MSFSRVIADLPEIHVCVQANAAGLISRVKLSISASFQCEIDEKLSLSARDDLLDWLHAYANKEKHPFPGGPELLAYTSLPPFIERLLQKLPTISFGQVTTYQKAAASIGNPKGARAVGNACGRNPFPLLIPCHRVLAAGNRLGGYTGTGGTSLKERLLKFEGVW